VLPSKPLPRARAGGESIPLDLTEGNEGRWGLVSAFRGPVLAISPFNFPLIWSRTGGPALPRLPVILKPASQTPFTAWRWRVILKAGWPAERWRLAAQQRGHRCSAEKETASSWSALPLGQWLGSEGSLGASGVLELGGNARHRPRRLRLDERARTARAFCSPPSS